MVIVGLSDVFKDAAVRINVANELLVSQGKEIKPSRDRDLYQN
jgi:hypothetical protein